MKTLAQIEIEFDKQTKEFLDELNYPLFKKVKSFYRKKMRQWALGLVGKDDCYLTDKGVYVGGLASAPIMDKIRNQLRKEIRTRINEETK